MSGVGRPKRKCALRALFDSSQSSSSKKLKTPKKTDKNPNEGRNAKVGRMKYVAKKPELYRPFQQGYNKNYNPSDEDIKKEMKRVAEATEDVIKKKEEHISEEWEKMKNDVEVLKIDDKNIMPFIFTGVKRIYCKPPPRKCQAQIPRTFFYEPLTENIDGKDEPQLSNIPIIDKNQHDTSMIHHLHEIYKSRVHGYHWNNFDISEEMLYMVMKKVLPGTENADLLYYALYKTFNNSGSQEEFSRMFQKLHRVYGNGEDLRNMEPWKEQKDDDSSIEFGPKNCKPLGVGKKVHVRSSKIAGNGLFLGEGVKKNEYLGEYVGERCSEEETVRRAEVGLLGISYVFSLPNKTSIDSGRAGNVFRFMNHSEKPNCYTKYTENDTRIGIYADREIKSEEELTIDYSYSATFANILLKHGPSDRVPLVEEQNQRSSRRIPLVF